MKSKPLPDRPPSRLKNAENDLNRAFASLEEDILSLQSIIERSKIKNLDSGVHRGKLNSRRSLNTSSKQYSSFSLETSMTLQQYRNSTLTEPIYNLIISTLGPQYSSIPSETILRLSLLKIKLHEIYLKKILEISALKLGDFEIDPDVRVFSLVCKLCETNENKESKENYDEGRVKELEGEVNDARGELKKEAKGRKEAEDMIARYVVSDRQKGQELEEMQKRMKEIEVDRNRVSVLTSEIERIRRKLEEKENMEARALFLQSEVENRAQKIEELVGANEKSMRENKRLKENVEKFKTLEKINLSNIETLNSELKDLKMKSQNVERMAKEIEDLKAKIAEYDQLKVRMDSLAASHKEELRALQVLHTSQLSELSSAHTTSTSLLTNEIATLKSTLKQSESNFISDLNHLQSSNSALNSELLQLHSSLEKVQSELSSQNSLLSLKSSELCTEKTKTESLNSTISELNSKLSAQDLKLKDLTAQLTNSKLNSNFEQFLNSEVSKLKTECSMLASKVDEKTVQNERCGIEIRSLKSELAKCQAMCERLQDKFAKVGNAEEDTFENVMRQELAIMRDAYEKKLKEARDEMDSMKKKNLNEVKKIREELRAVENSREYLEIRLKSLQN